MVDELPKQTAHANGEEEEKREEVGEGELLAVADRPVGDHKRRPPMQRGLRIDHLHACSRRCDCRVGMVRVRSWILRF